MKATLAVLITYYNENELLRECLVSLTSQSPIPDEILIYDDASSRPAKDFIPPGANVRIIRGETNVGPSHARNLLLAECQSDFAHFHDADDLFMPGWTAKIRETIAGGADFILTEVDAFENSQCIGRSIQRLERLNSGKDPVRFCIEGAILPSAATCRTSLLRKVGGYPEDLPQSEDFLFHVRIAAQAPQIRAITESLVIKRSHPGNRSRDQVEVWHCTLKAVLMLTMELPERYVRDLAEAAARVGSVLFSMGDLEGARKAFRAATALGPAQHFHRSPVFRWLARMLGQEPAEHFGSLYGKLAPTKLKRFILRRTG